MLFIRLKVPPRREEVEVNASVCVGVNREVQCVRSLEVEERRLRRTIDPSSIFDCLTSSPIPTVI